LIVFYKQDLAAAKERIAKLGGTISRDIFSFPGGRRFHFTDPNGNEYAIWSE
jgi:predicted enzyme related to lactoylglutathione lyase